MPPLYRARATVSLTYIVACRAGPRQRTNEAEHGWMHTPRTQFRSGFNHVIIMLNVSNGRFRLYIQLYVQPRCSRNEATSCACGACTPHA
eukprot:3242709-Prymnesium_polylepis.1